MTTMTLPGGTYPIGDRTVTRTGYGAMQLAGPGVFGPPRDRAEAIAVLREVVDLGITHIDTSDFYGPHVTNEIIRAALHPYPEELTIVTKVGARRDDQATLLSHEIAREIEKELEYPGQIKVTVIRESRAVEYAR